jgi:FkbM family methyltransferase
MLRRLGRTAGLNRAIAVLLKRGEGYESRFRQTMLALVREGDCVWDVGANAGYYSRLFAERVGQRGQVFAFEPDPRVLARLEQSVRLLGNVTIVPVALADRDGMMRFRPGLDAVGATGQLIDADRPSAGTWIEMPVLRGDSVVARRMATPRTSSKLTLRASSSKCCGASRLFWIGRRFGRLAWRSTSPCSTDEVDETPHARSSGCYTRSALDVAGRIIPTS